MSNEQALCLATGDLLIKANNAYGTTLLAFLTKIPTDEKSVELEDELTADASNLRYSNTDSARRHLDGPFARSVMYVIWKESNWVSEQALATAMLSRKYDQSKTLTRNSIKNDICEELNLSSAQGDALRQKVSAICDAMEVFGLITRDTKKTNSVEIIGTSALNELMVSVHRSVSDVIKSATDRGHGG